MPNDTSGGGLWAPADSSAQSGREAYQESKGRLTEPARWKPRELA